MKAVNLMPTGERRGGGVPGGSAAGTYGVLGFLGLALALVVVFVLSANGVKEREGRLATVTAEAEATQAQAAALKPFGDFATLAQARVTAVRTIADGRVDWATAVRGLSVAIPADVTLITMDATLAPDPAAPGSSRPTIALTGCTTSQRSTARLLASLRQVSSVDRVDLTSSTMTRQAPAEQCGTRTLELAVNVVFPATVAAAPGAAPAAPAAPAEPSATPPAEGTTVPPAEGDAAPPAEGTTTTPEATTSVPATPATPEVDTTAATNGGGS